MTKDTIAIHDKDYEKVLRKVRDSIISAQNSITRSKVEMAWKIGKVIEEILPQDNREKYGQQLLKKMEDDTSTGVSSLYKIHSFYQSYPKLPKDDPALK